MALLKNVEPKHISNARHYWDDWQTKQSNEKTSYVDWADHPTVIGNVYEAAFGDSQTDLLQYFKRDYPYLAKCDALSLCCGDGSFERKLIDRNIFASVTGIDLSPVRIQVACETNADVSDRLRFNVGDVNDGAIGSRCYDVVFAKAALHHVEKLEKLTKGICQALRENGVLIAIDFFGATRFQWSDVQISAANWFLQNRIPEGLRRHADGTVYKEVHRPTPAEMIAIDPSEAIRSGELLQVLNHSFDFTADIPLGGTLLNLIFFGDIINNFDAQDPMHNELINEAFQYERALMADGTIGSDFRLIVATPRN